MHSAEKRVRGIEPPSKAWEAFILPLNHTRKTTGKLHALSATVKQEQIWTRDGQMFQRSDDLSL